MQDLTHIDEGGRQASFVFFPLPPQLVGTPAAAAGRAGFPYGCCAGFFNFWMHLPNALLLLAFVPYLFLNAGAPIC